jgi:acyl carrier protein
MQENFLLKFREVLEAPEKEISLDDMFRDYEEWNSLAFLSLIAMIDEEFDVIIEGKDFKQLQTVGDIIQAIKERQ